MAYILRFVQHYRPADQEAFLELEAKFHELERSCPNLPQGRRYQPVATNEPTNTLVWECEFPTLNEVEHALAQLSDDQRHTELFERQSPYITGMWTEIYKVLEF